MKGKEKRPPVLVAGAWSRLETKDHDSFESYSLAFAPATDFGRRRDDAERLMSEINPCYALLLSYGGRGRRIVWHRPENDREPARMAVQSLRDFRNFLLPRKGPDGRTPLAEWWLSLGPVHALTFARLVWWPGMPPLVPVRGTAMFVRNLFPDLDPERDFTRAPEDGETIGGRSRLRRWS